MMKSTAVFGFHSSFRTSPIEAEIRTRDVERLGAPERLAMKRFVCLALLILICLTGFAVAQETRATISGAVTDQSGAVLPGAKVVATEIRTNTKTATVADSSGQYNIPFLAPGQYDLEAEMQGFTR